MKILVINSGSSSIKYQLLDLPDNKVLCKGLVERIGLEDAELHYATDDNQIDKTMDIPNHEVGLEAVSRLLMDPEVGVIKDASEINAVGHRVVHGGNAFTKTVVINDEVKSVIKSLFTLAPLHNPPNLMGIEVAEKVFPQATQVGVFDTAFHQTMPEVSHRFAIPNEYYDKDHLRVYGFHGTSHKYVSEQAVEHLGKKHSKIITLHLGNGCSMTAVQDGKSVDHSLGFGPMNGLIMGTRSGDLDQAVILYLMEKYNYSAADISTILQKKSGMLGLTGMVDMRDIEKAANEGDRMAALALDMNAYRIKKFIGAFAAAMNGLDAIVFTAGIGENSADMRQRVCESMDYLGIELDSEKNQGRKKSFEEIQTDNSRVKIYVIPTNEELGIAQQTYDLVK
ncbi:MAG: acetate kinase [Flavobacteriia bacterium]|nr:MAG: acetate kinase [Flavobacteriia bacterium]